MSLAKTIYKEYNELDQNEIISSVFYINEFRRLDPQCDAEIRIAIKKSIRRGFKPSKKVTLSDFTKDELLDITNPIEH